MPVSLQLKQFTGPLDLLLQLLDERKLSIADVSLSEVTEQYLDYLGDITDEQANEIADFLVIATRLLLLKSRMLLPQFAPEEDEGPSLEDQLRLYKLFVQASKQVNDRWLLPARSIFRIEPPRRHDRFIAPKNATLELLHQSMVQLLNRLAPPKPLPKSFIDKAVSMSQKIDAIRALLKKRSTIGFQELLSDAGNRTEIIVSFLALLELVKGHVIGLRQNGEFGEILVERV